MTSKFPAFPATGQSPTAPETDSSPRTAPVTRTYRCPCCESSFKMESRTRIFPFCSERCKQIDLGRWLGGDYSIAGRPLDREALVGRAMLGGSLLGQTGEELES